MRPGPVAAGGFAGTAGVEGTAEGGVSLGKPQTMAAAATATGMRTNQRFFFDAPGMLNPTP